MIRWRIADGDMVVLVVALVGGVALGPPAALVVVGGALLARRPAAVLMAAAVLVVIGAALWRSAWAATQSPTLGPVHGYVEVVADPLPAGRGVRLTVQVDEQRFDAWIYGAPRRRAIELERGQWVFVEGTRRGLGAGAARARQRHVVGRLDVRVLGDVSQGTAVWQSAARLRAAVRASGERAMGAADAALFSGLVLGDDTRQQPGVVDAFRRAGLSHLTAVSGQNITLLLGMLGPLLRRLRPTPRLMATLTIVAWLMLVTRFEPSVLRAGAMAALVAVAFRLGRPSAPLRLLAVAVGALIVLDPLLVRSVGLWLSVGATVGVVAIAPRLADLVPGPAWLRGPLAITLGAQIGVAVPSVVVFGRLPLVAPLANLAAVPVAAVVMTVGIPCALAAHAIPLLSPVVMAVPTIGTRWVQRVAMVAAEVEPGPQAGIAGWLLIGAWLSWKWRRRPHPLAPGVPS